MKRKNTGCTIVTILAAICIPLMGLGIYSFFGSFARRPADESRGFILDFMSTSGGLFFFGILPCFVFLVLTLIARIRVNSKAGQPGWAVIIPGYDLYIRYKTAGLRRPLLHTIVFSGSCIIWYLNTAFLRISGLSLMICLLMCALHIVYSIKLARSFRHGLLFAIGLILIHDLFLIILGFGDSEYVPPEKSIRTKVGFCGQCGARLDADAEICPWCGRKR